MDHLSFEERLVSLENFYKKIHEYIFGCDSHDIKEEMKSIKSALNKKVNKICEIIYKQKNEFSDSINSLNNKISMCETLFNQTSLEYKTHNASNVFCDPIDTSIIRTKDNDITNKSFSSNKSYSIKRNTDKLKVELINNFDILEDKESLVKNYEFFTMTVCDSSLLNDLSSTAMSISGVSEYLTKNNKETFSIKRPRNRGTKLLEVSKVNDTSENCSLNNNISNISNQYNGSNSDKLGIVDSNIIDKKILTVDTTVVDNDMLVDTTTSNTNDSDLSKSNEKRYINNIKTLKRVDDDNMQLDAIKSIEQPKNENYIKDNQYWEFLIDEGRVVPKRKAVKNVTKNMLSELIPYLANETITSFEEMFKGCFCLESVEFPNGFDTSKIKSMKNMFHSCFALESIKFSTSFNTCSVSTMEGLFNYCKRLKIIDLPINFNTSNVKDMQLMFCGCERLEKIYFPRAFNTSNVLNMTGMFSGCTSIKVLEFHEGFDTRNCTSLQGMFYNCTNLNYVSFPEEFDTSNVKSMDSMFYGCTNLGNVKLQKPFNFFNVIYSSRMLYGTSLNRKTFEMRRSIN